MGLDVWYFGIKLKWKVLEFHTVCGEIPSEICQQREKKAPSLAGAAFALWWRESFTDRESKFGRKEERETERMQSSARERVKN